ncbi:MAG: hypothetical protein L6R36_009240, partial [Xanthoria steineri]
MPFSRNTQSGPPRWLRLRSSTYFIGTVIFVATFTSSEYKCLQGASAGIVYTVGLALLVDTVGRNEVGAWMGSALSGMSAGVMIGPFIAGIIYAKAGYLAVFATILAVIGLDFMARLFMIEKQSAKQWVVEGVGITMMLAPLAADMYYIVSHVGEKHSVLVGTGGAFAQAYGLLNTALALGTITGPALAGLIYDREGWYKAMWAMAAFCASGVVPV